jgi:hypothetical protein
VTEHWAGALHRKRAVACREADTLRSALHRSMDSR